MRRLANAALLRDDGCIPLRDSVAAIGQLHEGWPIENGDHPPLAADKLAVLKLAQGNGDTGALHPEHYRQKLMSERQRP